MDSKDPPKPEITLSVFLNLHFSVLPGRRWRRHRGQSPVGRRGWCPPCFDFLLSIFHFSMKMILVHFLRESSFSLFKVLRFLSHWLSWGNFVGRRRVFSGQGAVFLFSSFANLLLIFFGKLGSLGRSLIVHVFSSVSWGYHRWGYGFGLVSVGTGGPSYDVEALTTMVRQGDEIIPLKIGPLVRFWSIDFLPFLLTTAGLFKDQKISVYKFACSCLRDTDVALLVVRTSLSLFSLRREASEREFHIEEK